MEFFNSEVLRFHVAISKDISDVDLDSFLSNDPTKISWTSSLKADVARNITHRMIPERIRTSVYRPFTKMFLYYDKSLNHRVGQMPRIFPDARAENRVIGVSASASRGGYSVLISGLPPSLHATDMVGSQYFPLYLYDDSAETRATASNADLFAGAANSKLVRRDAITDAGLTHFLNAYPGQMISKQDLFYYVYGLLHSEEYHNRFADNLAKELPRIPAVKSVAVFRAFSAAGRALAALHIDYETVAQHPATLDFVKPRDRFTPTDWRVEKMRFAKGQDRTRHDKTAVAYNHNVTIRDIPLEAYDYVVNGKPALEWVMERQAVTIDKDSGIINDANDWAIETMNNPAYPMELFLRVITVSLETMKIVRSLPALEVD